MRMYRGYISSKEIAHVKLHLQKLSERKESFMS